MLLTTLYIVVAEEWDAGSTHRRPGSNLRLTLNILLLALANCRAFENQRLGLERPAVGPYFM